MGCELINGIVCDCTYSASGVEKLWVANKSEISGVTYNAGGEITWITFYDPMYQSNGTLITATGQTFYEICPSVDSCTYTDDLQISGSRRNFLQTINFGLGSISPTVLVTLETIGLSNLVAVVKTADGEYRAMGVKGSGLRTTIMTENSGTATANDAAIAVTISGNAKGKASFLADACVTGLHLI